MMTSLEEYEVTFKSPSMGMHFEPLIKSGTKQIGCKIKSLNNSNSNSTSSSTKSTGSSSMSPSHIHELLEVGDILFAINGMSVEGLSYVSILQSLKDLVSSERKLTFAKQSPLKKPIPSSRTAAFVMTTPGGKDKSFDDDVDDIMSYKSSLSEFSTPEPNSSSRATYNKVNPSMNDNSFLNENLSLSSILETTPKKVSEFNSKFNPAVCNLNGPNDFNNIAADKENSQHYLQRSYSKSHNISKYGEIKSILKDHNSELNITSSANKTTPFNGGKIIVSSSIASSSKQLSSQKKSVGGGGGINANFEIFTGALSFSPKDVKSISKSKRDLTVRQALADLNPNTLQSNFDLAATNDAISAKIVLKSNNSNNLVQCLDKDSKFYDTVFASDSENSNGSISYTCKKSDQSLSTAKSAEGGGFYNSKLSEKLGLNHFLSSVKHHLLDLTALGNDAGSLISTAFDSLPQYSVSDMDKVNSCKFKLLQELSETSYSLGITIDNYAKELQDKNAEIAAHTMEIDNLNKKNRELKKKYHEKTNAMNNLNQQLSTFQSHSADLSSSDSNPRNVKLGGEGSDDVQGVIEELVHLRESNQISNEMNVLLKNELSYKNKEIEDMRLRFASMQEKSSSRDAQHKEDIDKLEAKIRMQKDHLDKQKEESQSAHHEHISLIDKYRKVVDKLSSLNSEHATVDTSIRTFLGHFNEIIKPELGSSSLSSECCLSLEEVSHWLSSHHGSSEALKGEIRVSAVKIDYLSERLSLAESSFGSTHSKLTELLDRCQSDIWPSIKECKICLEGAKVDTALALNEMKEIYSTSLSQLARAVSLRLDQMKTANSQLQASIASSELEKDNIKANSASEVEKLSLQNKTLEIALSASNKAIEELRGISVEFDCLQNLAKMQEGHISELESKVSSKVIENSELRLQNEEFEKNFNANVAIYDAKIKELNSSSSFEIESLKKQILTIKQSSADELGHLKDDNAKGALLIEDLGVQLLGVKKDKMDLETKLQQCQKHINLLDITVSNKTSEIATLQTNIEIFQSQLSSNGLSWDSERSRLLTTIKSIELSLEQQKDSYLSISSERESLLSQMKVTHQTMKTLQNSHDKALVSLSSQIQDLVQENLALKEKNLALQKENLSFKERITVADSSILNSNVDFENKLEEMNIKHSALEVDNSKLKLDLQNELKRYDELFERNNSTADKMVALQKEHIDCLEKHEISALNMKQTIQTQEGTIKELERAILDFKSSISISRSVIDELNETIKSQTSSILELEKTGNVAIKELEELLGKNEMQKGIISEMTCRLTNAEAALETQQFESEESSHNLHAQLINQQIESEKVVSSLQTQLAESEAKVLKCSCDLEDSLLKYNALMKDYEVLLHDSSERTSKLEIDCSTLIETNSILESEYQVTKESASKLLELNKSLTESNKLLTEDAANAENSLRILQKLHDDFLESRDVIVQNLGKSSEMLYSKENIISELNARLATFESLLEMQGADFLQRSTDTSAEIKSLKSNCQRLEDLERELLSTNSAQSIRIEELKSEQIESEKVVSSLQTQLAESEAKVLKCSCDLEDSLLKYNALMKDYEVLLHDSSERTSKLEIDCSTLIETNSILEGEKVALTAELETENTRANELHDLNASLTLEVLKLEESLKVMTESRDVLITELKQTVNAKDEIDASLAVSTDRIFKVEAECSELTKRNVDLVAELYSVTKEYQKVKNLEGQLIDTVSTHTALLDEVQRREIEHKTHIDSFKSKIDEILVASEKRSRNLINSHEESVRSLIEEIRRLNSELDISQLNYSLTLDELNALQNQVKELVANNDAILLTPLKAARGGGSHLDEFSSSRRNRDIFASLEGKASSDLADSASQVEKLITSASSINHYTAITSASSASNSNTATAGSNPTLSALLAWHDFIMLKFLDLHECLTFLFLEVFALLSDLKLHPHPDNPDKKNLIQTFFEDPEKILKLILDDSNLRTRMSMKTLFSKFFSTIGPSLIKYSQVLHQCHNVLLKAPFITTGGGKSIESVPPVHELVSDLDPGWRPSSSSSLSEIEKEKDDSKDLEIKSLQFMISKLSENQMMMEKKLSDQTEAIMNLESSNCSLNATISNLQSRSSDNSSSNSRFGGSSSSFALLDKYLSVSECDDAPMTGKAKVSKEGAERVTSFLSSGTITGSSCSHSTDVVERTARGCLVSSLDSISSGKLSDCHKNSTYSNEINSVSSSLSDFNLLDNDFPGKSQHFGQSSSFMLDTSDDSDVLRTSLSEEAQFKSSSAAASTSNTFVSGKASKVTAVDVLSSINSFDGKMKLNVSLNDSNAWQLSSDSESESSDEEEDSEA